MEIILKKLINHLIINGLIEKTLRGIPKGREEENNYY